MSEAPPRRSGAAGRTVTLSRCHGPRGEIGMSAPISEGTREEKRPPRTGRAYNSRSRFACVDKYPGHIDRIGPNHSYRVRRLEPLKLATAPCLRYRADHPSRRIHRRRHARSVADRNAQLYSKARSAAAHQHQPATQEPTRRPRAVEADRPLARIAGRPDTTQIGRFWAPRPVSALGGGGRRVHDVQETS